MVGKIFFKILSFFIFCFIVKCTDDNYVFVDIYYSLYGYLYDIKGNLEEQKVKIDDDFANKDYNSFLNKIAEKTSYKKYDKTTEYFSEVLKNPDPPKLEYIMVCNTVIRENKTYKNDYNVFRRLLELNDKFISEEIKIYKNFSEMIDDNNYKQKTIFLIYSGGNFDYNEYKKNIKKIKLGTQTINLKNEVKIEDKDINILSILKNENGYNIFTKKINENLEENVDKEQEINFSSDASKPDNKKFEDFLKLGGFLECTNYDKDSETCTVSAKYKRKIKLHFKVPKDYEIVDYFKDDITFDMYLDNFKIRNLLQKLLDFIKTYNDLKSYTLEPYNIICHEMDFLFNTIEDNCDYHGLGIFAKCLKIKGKNINNNNFEKIINNKTEYDNLQDTDIFESKNNENIDIEIDLGIYSELLKTDYVILNFEAPDGYVLCDRLNKKVCFPIPLQLYENNHNQCFEDQMRFLGIISKNADEINLKFPKDFYNIKWSADDIKYELNHIYDMKKITVKLTSKTIGKYSKNAGEPDPKPYDPDNDEKYKNDKRNYTNINPPKENPPIENPQVDPPAPTPVEDIDNKGIDKNLGCCAKCMSSICCCCKSKT